MTASTILQTRTALKDALATVSANVYSSVPEAVISPIVTVLAADPYMEINLIGRAAIKVKLNFLLKIGVSYINDAAAIDNLEQLILAVLGVIPAGYEVGDVSAPAPYDVGDGRLLMSDIFISTYYTQTA